MAFVLDTSVLIEIRDGVPEVEGKVKALDGPKWMSVVSRVELDGGVYRDPALSASRRPRLDAMLALIPAIPFDDDCADVYRAIVEAAGYSRRKVLDRMIAAQALARNATLITYNAADFSDVIGLKLEAW